MNHGAPEDTICAVATPMGEGGIGIVRMSGPRALELAARIVRLRRPQGFEDVKSHRLYVGDLLAGQPQAVFASSGQAISGLDEVLVAIMRGPRSYTGEDVVEIHCHGGPLILQLACETLIRVGARLAEPGEFTKRAFLNGRLDLTRAEAVLDTIRATTTAGLHIAQRQLHGELYRRIEHMRQELLSLLAHLEAGMDFVEEDVTFIEPCTIQQILDRLLHEITQLLETADQGRILREGLLTAIIGRPNVGKSSLLNALLQTDRAIVSHIPGTTRDTVEDLLNIHGMPLRLADTAGLRETDNLIEQEGIRRTTEVVEHAELLLIVVDGSQPLTDDDRALLTIASEKKRLVVLNKMDLAPCVTEAQIQDHLSCSRTPLSSVEVVSVSAKTGMGLDTLRSRIQTLILGRHYEAPPSILLTRLRHKTALNEAKSALEHARLALDQGLSSECIALDIRMGLTALGELTGAVSTEDLLDKIFSEFCIGK